MENDIQKVRKLGEDIGYDQLMNLASALWRKKMTDLGSSFINVCIPVPIIMINDELRKKVNVDIKYYDKVVSPSKPVSNHYFKE